MLGSRSTSRAGAAEPARRATPRRDNVNPIGPVSERATSSYGRGGGQAEYVMVPYAALEPAEVSDKEQAMEKILDLTMLSDIFPTGYHGRVHGGA